jgi:putative FmdB family regulatory protein
MGVSSVFFRWSFSFSSLDKSVRIDIHVAQAHKHPFGPALVNYASAGLNCNLFNADFPASFLKACSPAKFLMPTYDYSCQKCRQTFEAFQSMRDEPFRECPKELCRLPKWGHGKVKRLLGTGAGLIFKGSGFYSTDYRSESYKAAAKKESAPKTSEGSDKSSKTEPAKAPSSVETKTAEKKSAKESG